MNPLHLVLNYYSQNPCPLIQKTENEAVAKPRTQEPPGFHDLPPPVLAKILSYLEPETHVVCRSVCRKLRVIVPLNLNAAENLCAHAAIHGHLSVLKWARAYSWIDSLLGIPARKAPWQANVCALAAKYGHTELLQWAQANGPKTHVKK
jgi:hypothetical protein